MRVGQKLRLFREFRNISREAMANILGVSLRTYQDIENDRRQLDVEELEIAATHLDVPVEVFLADNFNFVQINNGDNSPAGANNYSSNISGFDKEVMNEIVQLLRVLVNKLSKE